jgi:hypothetical protein
VPTIVGLAPKQVVAAAAGDVPRTTGSPSDAAAQQIPIPVRKRVTEAALPHS